MSLSDLLDAGLVERARAGERAALEELSSKLWGPVFIFIRGRIRDEERARDLTQDTFLQLCEKVAGLRHDQSLVAWLFTIASHKVIDCYRRQGANPVTAGYDEEQLEAAASVGREEHSTFPDREGAAGLSQVEDAARVQAALERLGDRYRAVLILRYWSGLTPAQIARLLDEPEGTIRNRIFRAHQHLRAQLGDEPLPAGSAGPLPAARATRISKENSP